MDELWVEPTEDMFMDEWFDELRRRAINGLMNLKDLDFSNCTSIDQVADLMKEKTEELKNN